MGDAAYVPLDALTRMVRPDLRPLQGVAQTGALASDAGLEPVPPHEGGASRSAQAGKASLGKSFHIETFGCQMNVHDSEKVAGVLLERGYSLVADPLSADVVFYNTCSIREKAAPKVFSRLGQFRARTGSERLTQPEIQRRDLFFVARVLSRADCAAG